MSRPVPNMSPASPLSPAKLQAMATLAEQAALMVGHEVFHHRRPADRALATFHRERRNLGGRDRRFIAATVFALFRWWGWLKTMLPPPETGLFASSAVGDEPTRPGDPTALARLLLAAALIDADPAAPPPAAMVWAERLAWSPAQFATLEAIADPAARARQLLTMISAAPPASLAATQLVPDWLPAALMPEIPAEKFILWSQRRPPLWLRANPAAAADQLAQKFRDQGIAVAVHPRLPGALALSGARLNMADLPEFRAGLCEIQDAASQGIVMAAALAPGEHWWDVCAGAGGKTLQLGALLAGRGHILATDVRHHPLDELLRRARRAGLRRLHVEPWDGIRLPPPWHGAFDGVLVDAPCSGTGTWRRNPDARWRIVPDDIAGLVATQGRILDTVAAAVKPGGRLVYATCSALEQENNAIVQTFLAAQPDFSLHPFPHPLSGRPTAGMTQILPWEGDHDATFVAVLVRRRALSPQP